MTKILIVCGKLYIGGAEKVAYCLGHYRNKEKYDCHYLVFGDGIGTYEEELTTDGCKIIHLPVPADNYINFWKQLNALLKKEKYDVVHCHTMFNSGIVLLASKLNGVKGLIAHSHSICSSKKRKLTKKLYEKLMRSIIVHCATDYVACGEAAGKWLFGEKVFNKSGQLILNGIDVPLYRYDEDKAAKIKNELSIEDRFVIGHVGHLTKVKNQTFILNLMNDIVAKLPNAVLLLIGEGDDRVMLEAKITELNISDYVIMTGNVMNVQEYLSAMDVFVFPSLYEGMPLSIIEVQANGLPCVISDAVPKDVFLTDLLEELPLTASQDRWIDAIINSKRNNSCEYNDIMYNTGFDTHVMLEKIYDIYDKYSN